VVEGSTENATACTRLVTDLADRGLDADHGVLFVIDGGKALAKAIRATFGGKANKYGRPSVNRDQPLGSQVGSHSLWIHADPRRTPLDPFSALFGGMVLLFGPWDWDVE
jgi:hypothetical protein